MSDKENLSTVELPRRERNPIVLKDNFISTKKENEKSNTETIRPTFETLNRITFDTQKSPKTNKKSFTVNTTEKKRKGDTEEQEELKEIKPLKLQHRQDKENLAISSEQELEVLRDELFKLENEGKALEEYNDLLNYQIATTRKELTIEKMQEIKTSLREMQQELDEYEENDAELSSLLEETNQKGLEFSLASKTKDDAISDLLNILSETKYKILELQEQQ